MYAFLFKSKLRHLNPRLVLGQETAASITEERKACALYFETSKRGSEQGMHVLSGDARRYYEAAQKGQAQEFICAISTDWIPEYDEFDPQSGRLIARGFRTILMTLVKRGYVSLERARRVFNLPSLGEARYDRMTYEEKRADQYQPEPTNAF